jgi:hypothetical protein
MTNTPQGGFVQIGGSVRFATANAGSEITKVPNPRNASPSWPMHKAGIALGFLALSLVCRAELEFAAYMQAGGDVRFEIADNATKTSSGWITLGQSFHDYRVTAFDPKKEVLSVRKEGASLDLPLKGSHVQAGGLPPELLRRGITSADLLLRWDESAQIYLGLVTQEKPVRKRLVRVEVHTESGNFVRSFDETSPGPMTREMLPKAAQAALSDADIDDINRHLAQVLPKWLPEQAPGQLPAAKS